MGGSWWWCWANLDIYPLIFSGGNIYFIPFNRESAEVKRFTSDFLGEFFHNISVLRSLSDVLTERLDSLEQFKVHNDYQVKYLDRKLFNEIRYLDQVKGKQLTPRS